MGEKGEGKWQQISWDQAFDEIAAKKIPRFHKDYKERKSGRRKETVDD